MEDIIIVIKKLRKLRGNFCNNSNLLTFILNLSIGTFLLLGYSSHRNNLYMYLVMVLALMLPLAIILGFNHNKQKSDKEKEEILNRENKFLGNILNAISDPFYVIDASNYNIIMANSKAKESWNNKDGAVTTCYGLTHHAQSPCNSKDHPCPLFEVKKTKDPVVVQHKHYDENGKPKYYEIHGYPILDEDGNLDKLIEYSVDITMKKELLEKLRMFYKIVDQNPLPIISTDLDGKIMYVNPKFTELTGYEFKEVYNRKPSILKSGKVNQETYSQLWNTIISGRTWKGEFYNKKKDGTYYWESANITPVINQEGEIYQYIAIKEDITELRSVEERLRIETEKANKLRIAAEASSKAKSDFIATISHEIRTPMNAIIGFSRLALETDLDDKQKNYIKKVETSANSLLGIINSVLEISKIESNTLTMENLPFNLNDVIDSIVDVASYSANEKGLCLIKDIRKDVPVNLIGDRTLLHHIISNVANNAVKFTSKGGVELNIKLIEDYTDKCKLRFTITDTGIGIPPDKMDKIFESFTQADMSISRIYGGTGLGLTIAKYMTEKLGGDIQVESEEGIGSSFYITIPFEKQIGTADSSLVNGHKDIPNLKDLFILVVEDNKINQELIINILTNYRIRTEVAENGAEALDKLKDKGFDLILMDISMPVMDGYKATEQIRKTYSIADLPIIAMTANVDVSDINRSLSIGMNDYIGKPIDVDKLLFKIGRWTSSQVKINIEEINNKPSIDAEKALDRLGGNKPLYNRLLRDFFVSNKGLIPDLRDLYLKGDIEGLIFKIHSLKGTSGNLGLTKVYETSISFERELKENNLDNFNNYIELLEKAMKVGLEYLEDKRNRNDDKEYVGFKRIEEISDLLLKLEKYLEDYDIKALELMSGFYIDKEFPELSEMNNELRDLVNKFEYEKSIVMIRKMKSLIGGK